MSDNSVVQTTIGDDHVAIIELCSPPNNFFSLDLIGGVADATGSFTAPYLLMAAMTAVSVAAVVALRDTDREGTDRMAAPAVS